MTSLFKPSIKQRDQQCCFCFDQTNDLAMFAKGPSKSKTKTSLLNSKRTGSKKISCKACVDETVSNSNIEDSLDMADEVQKKLPKKIFRLLYLPLHLPKAEILQKLSKFGEVVNFSFSPVEKTDPHLTDPSRVPNFQCAEFSFEQASSIEHFTGVKRIRIRGLQVRVSEKEMPKFSPKPTASSLQQQEPNQDSNDHSIKPTQKVYHSSRPVLHQNQSQYYWRISTFNPQTTPSEFFN